MAGKAGNVYVPHFQPNPLTYPSRTPPSCTSASPSLHPAPACQHPTFMPTSTSTHPSAVATAPRVHDDSASQRPRQDQGNAGPGEEALTVTDQESPDPTSGLSPGSGDHTHVESLPLYPKGHFGLWLRGAPSAPLEPLLCVRASAGEPAPEQRAPGSALCSGLEAHSQHAGERV